VREREMGQRTLRLTVVLALAAVLAVTLGLGSAGAHKRKIPRQTTLAFEELPGSTGDRISGQVSIGSPPEQTDPGGGGGGEPLARTAGLAGSCLRGQRVLIKHNLTSEGGGGGEPTVVATAVTDATGAWQTTAYEASGANQFKFDTFKVEVEKKRMKPKNARHKHVCIGAFANKTVFSG
jgi:hypothetical protein